MKTLLHLLIVALYVFPNLDCTRSVVEVDCREISGTVPVPIFNSPYTILPNGSLCCPLFPRDSCNQDEKVIATKCPGGLVFEPCHFCKTCAKSAGERCGGIQNQHGTCDQGLECAERDQNGTGTCYGKGMHLVLKCVIIV